MQKDKYKSRLFDLINPDEVEVKLSIIFTVIIICAFRFIEFYEKFAMFETKLCSVIELIAGSFIGLLGFSVSGIAIIVTLFTKEETFLISKINGENDIERILGSYKFLSYSLAVEILYLVILDFCISSDKELVGEVLFWIINIVIIYHFCFNIFYLLALIKNCIELYNIKMIYGKLEKENGRSINDINEIRTDFILSILMNICNCTQHEIYEGLVEFVKNSSMEEKEKIIKYFSERYGTEKK